MHFPVLNILRNEFRLRTEVVDVFRKHNISEPDLIFLDQIPLDDLTRSKQLKLTLVDHNLPLYNMILDEAVVTVIDHHQNARHDSGLKLV